MRALLGNDYTIVTPPFTADDEQETPTDMATPVATVTRADGTTLTAPTVDDPTDSTGVVEIPLTAADHLDLLDQLTVTLAGTVDGKAVARSYVVDVTTAHPFEVSDVRALDRDMTLDKYPRSRVIAARDEMATGVEDYCDVAFSPSYRIVKLRGNGSSCLPLPVREVTAVRRVVVDGVAASLANVELEAYGQITYSAGFTANKIIEVHVECGMSAWPSDLTGAMLPHMRDLLGSRSTKGGQTATSETSIASGSVTRFAVPGTGRPSGIPALDVKMNRYKIPAIA